MLKKRGLAAAAIVAATLLPGFGALTHPAAASSATRTIAQNTDMFIYDPTGARLLGRAHYTVTQHDDVVTIEGRNDFIDGERDVEHDTLKAVDGGVPRMLTYQHDFFDEHGAPQITASADAVSGKSSCGKYADGKGTIETAVLQYPPDTYAGRGSAGAGGRSAAPRRHANSTSMSSIARWARAFWSCMPILRGKPGASGPTTASWPGPKRIRCSAGSTSF